MDLVGTVIFVGALALFVGVCVGAAIRGERTNNDSFWRGEYSKVKDKYDEAMVRAVQRDTAVTKFHHDYFLAQLPPHDPRRQGTGSVLIHAGGGGSPAPDVVEAMRQADMHRNGERT